MSEEPREYDREYRRSVPGPLRIRVGFDRSENEVERFVVQLEYQHDNAWHPVVRYDHDGTGHSEAAHDITEEGLHIDIYRHGEKHATEYIARVGDGAEGLNRAEEHLTSNLHDLSIGTNDGTGSKTNDR